MHRRRPCRSIVECGRTLFPTIQGQNQGAVMYAMTMLTVRVGHAFVRGLSRWSIRPMTLGKPFQGPFIGRVHSTSQCEVFCATSHAITKLIFAHPARAIPSWCRVVSHALNIACCNLSKARMCVAVNFFDGLLSPPVGKPCLLSSWRSNAPQLGSIVSQRRLSEIDLG